jgi:hypothetical protein
MRWPATSLHFLGSIYHNSFCTAKDFGSTLFLFRIFRIPRYQLRRVKNNMVPRPPQPVYDSYDQFLDAPYPYQDSVPFFMKGMTSRQVQAMLFWIYLAAAAIIVLRRLFMRLGQYTRVSGDVRT